MSMLIGTSVFEVGNTNNNTLANVCGAVVVTESLQEFILFIF